MKVAYADPPYFGCGKRIYGDQHPEAAVWDTKEAHLDLVEQLVDEYPDGWALSCNPSDLRWLLPACPEETRVCAWGKTWHQIRPLVAVQHSWEPVLVTGGRREQNRRPMVRDYLTCPVAMQRGVKGAKPERFCIWLFHLLGLEPTDRFDDVFPGSGAVTQAWERFRAQGVLL